MCQLPLRHLVVSKPAPSNPKQVTRPRIQNASPAEWMRRYATLLTKQQHTHSSRVFQLPLWRSSILLIVSRRLRSRFDSACCGGMIVGSVDDDAAGYLDMVGEVLIDDG